MDRDGKPMSEGGGTLFLASDAQRIGPGHFGRVVDYDAPPSGPERFSIHYEADLSRGGRSVLDIRPCNGRPTAGPSPAITRRQQRIDVTETTGVDHRVDHRCDSK